MPPANNVFRSKKEVWFIFVQLGYKPSGKTLAYKIYTAVQYEYNKAMKSVCPRPK